MAAVIGALRVDLGLNSAEFETGMNKAKGALGGLTKAFTALGGVALFAGVASGVGQAVGRIEEMRKLTDQLDQALANVGNTAKTSGSEVAAFADRLERSTGRAAEEIMAVSTNLATFGFNREVFFEAIELADDMSAAWGGDLKQNVEGLARALADPEKGLAMLTKRGITFTEQQKEMIAGFMKSNDLIGAQGVVLDALQEQVSGVAEAGFSGLTKAQANATLALEGFFEAIANSLGVNAGMEMSLIAVASALDFVTANIDLLAKGAAVAGSAIAVALGPSVWAAVSSAAVAMSATVIGAIRAIGVAIAANPIGFIITALAAAITAAIVFRDEIKQAIGVDFVGIVGAAVTSVARAFVGAFEGIKATWSMLPSALGDLVYQAANETVKAVQYMIRTVQVELNKFLAGVDRGLLSLGMKPLGLNVGAIEITGVENPFEGAASNVQAAFAEAFNSAQSMDLTGGLTTALDGVGLSANETNTALTALNDTVNNTGAAAGGAGAAVRDQMATALEAMRTALMTEEEAELASYEKRLEQIQAFYDQGLIQKAEYDAMMEAAHQQHSDRMSQITQRQVQEEARLRSGLVGHAAGIFGSLSTIMENFGEDNLVASKAFAVAAAIINTAEGITKALAQGGLLGFAGAAAVAAAGAAQISTILSAKKGGSLRPTVGASAPSVGQAASTPKPSQAVAITLQGDYHPTAQVEELIAKLIDLQSDGHQIILERP